MSSELTQTSIVEKLMKMSTWFVDLLKAEPIWGIFSPSTLALTSEQLWFWLLSFGLCLGLALLLRQTTNDNKTCHDVTGSRQRVAVSRHFRLSFLLPSQAQAHASKREMTEIGLGCWMIKCGLVARQPVATAPRSWNADDGENSRRGCLLLSLSLCACFQQPSTL